MSLLDVLDRTRSTSRPKAILPPAPSQYTLGAPSRSRSIASAPPAAANNSRERGVPERIDINSFVGDQEDDRSLPLQVAEVAGRAPGFVAERPLALVDTLFGQEQTPIDAVGGFGPVKFAGEVLGNFAGLPSALANSSTIESLARGVQEGWTDDMSIQSSLEGLAHNPVVDALTNALPFGIAQSTARINDNAKDRKVTTWGEFKEDALKRGFTGQDVEDYLAGRKSSTDFGDRSLSSDELTNLGLKFGSDPTNLVFGAGSLLHVASGVGLLARSIRAGAMAEKVAVPTLAARASAAGIAKDSTWVGLARYFGARGRGLGAVPGGAEAVGVASKGLGVAATGLRAYKKTAIALSAGQAGLKASENTPLSGFLEPLYGINDAVWDNQPLSHNMAFSLFSAFHFDAFRGIHAVVGAGKSTAANLFGSDVRTSVLRELSQGEGWGGRVALADVEQRLGGREALDNLITHTQAQAVFQRLLKNPALKNELSGYRSLDEAIAANNSLGAMVKDIVAEEFRTGSVKGRDVVRQLRAWYAERSGVEAAMDFPWDGRNAVDRWVEYGAAAAPISKIFKERGDIVVGLIDQPMAMDIRHMRAALGIKADAAGMVPVAEIRRWLNRFPQFATDAYWERFLADDMTGKSYPYTKLQGKLRAAEKKAPTARDVFREAGDAEDAAARDDLNAGEGRVQQFVDGTGQVVVSRMRPALAKRLKMDPTSVTDAMAARGAPETAAFEERVGQEMTKAGFDIESVTQAVQASDGLLEPAVQIHMPTSTLPEMRLAAAIAGRAASEEVATLAVTHGRLAELLLDPNGYEVALQLPTTNRVQMQLVSEALNREFGSTGWTMNDTTGRVSALVKGGTEEALAGTLRRITDEIGGFFDRDILNGSSVQSSVHPAYIERITAKKAGSSDGTYTDVIRESRRTGDARASVDLRPTLAYRRPAPGDAAARVGRDQAVGRQPGHERVTEGAGAQSAAERVGFANPLDLLPPAEGRGYLYHSTSEAALESIATQGLKPHGSDFRRGSLTWADGGTGARNFYGETATDAVASTARQGTINPLLRVRREDVGHIRNDRIEGSPYAMKSVSPQHIEVWGADGKWHPLDTFFTKLEPDIAAAAAEVAPVYRDGEAPATFAAAQDGVAEVLGEAKTFGDDFYRAAPPSPEWAYHATPAANLESVRTSGLLPAVPHDGGARDALGVYFGSNGQEVDSLLPRRQKSEVVILRARKNALELTDQYDPAIYGSTFDADVAAGLTGEYISRTPIAPDALEYLGGDGQWRPLSRPDASPPTFDPTPDTLSAGLRAIEDAGPAGGDAAALAELAGLGDTLSPESVQRGQELNLEIERARAGRGEARRGRATYMAQLDREASREYPLHRSLSDLPEEQLADLQPFEDYLRQHYPAYTIQKAPNAAIMLAGEGNIAARYLRDRTWLGNVLIEESKLSRLTDALFAPVRNSETGKASRQALMNELVPHGATPKEVDQFLASLNDMAKTQTIAGLHVFRNGQALTQETINRVAAGDRALGVKGVFKQSTIDAIGPKNFARVMDRASNRFIRMMDRQEGRRGALARVISGTYDVWAHSKAGDAGRVVGKTLYPIFRFMADPRWHAMNLVEADMLMGARYGIGATRFTGGDINAMSAATAIHSGGEEALKSHLAGDGTGFMYARRHIGHASRAFDAARPETTLDVLRAFGNDQVQTDLRELARLDDVAHGRPERAPGDLFDEDIVSVIDQQLYDFDMKGVQKTVIDAARENLGADELERLRPFLAKVWEANDKSFQSIIKTLGGNPDRSNLERVLNSYWLYWPLSYQVKATRWLVDVMTNKFGGAKTNLAPAAVYAHYVDEHRKRLATDPAYVDLFKSNPTAWFMAQMLFPITPGDVGVSLNRAVRYTGGALGWWGKYKSAEDPVTAAGAMLSLGPSYTAELLARLGRETFRGTTAHQAP